MYERGTEMNRLTIGSNSRIPLSSVILLQVILTRLILFLLDRKLVWLWWGMLMPTGMSS
jgi:hypothetical protein